MLSNNSIHITFPFCFLFLYDWGLTVFFILLQSFCVCFLWTALFGVLFWLFYWFNGLYNWFVRGLYIKRMSSLSYVLKYFSQLIICLLTLHVIFFCAENFYVITFTNLLNLGFVYCLEKLSHLQKEINSPIPTFNSFVIWFYAFKFLFTWKLALVKQLFKMFSTQLVSWLSHVGKF